MADSQFQRFSDRFFQLSPLFADPGWYIRLRDGGIDGPFPTRKAAQTMLFNLFGIPPQMSEGRIFSTEEGNLGLYSKDSRTS